MNMTNSTSLIGLLIFIADVYAIIKIVESNATALAKVLWILGVLLFPVVGLIVWFLAGPGGKN